MKLPNQQQQWAGVGGRATAGGGRVLLARTASTASGGSSAGSEQFHQYGMAMGTATRPQQNVMSTTRPQYGQAQMQPQRFEQVGLAPVPHIRLSQLLLQSSYEV